MIPIRDTIPHRNAPVMTWTIIAVNVFVFLYLAFVLGSKPERWTGRSPAA